MNGTLCDYLGNMKPIRATSFYSSKRPDLRIIVPADNNVSEDSDCDSEPESSTAQFRKRRFIDDPTVIPPSESDDETQASVPSKPARRKIKKVISCAKVDRYAEFETRMHLKRKEKQSKRKLDYLPTSTPLDPSTKKIPLSEINSEKQDNDLTEDQHRSPPSESLARSESEDLFCDSDLESKQDNHSEDLFSELGVESLQNKSKESSPTNQPHQNARRAISAPPPVRGNTCATRIRTSSISNVNAKPSDTGFVDESSITQSLASVVSSASLSAKKPAKRKNKTDNEEHVSKKKSLHGKIVIEDKENSPVKTSCLRSSRSTAAGPFGKKTDRASISSNRTVLNSVSSGNMELNDSAFLSEPSVTQTPRASASTSSCSVNRPGKRRNQTGKKTPAKKKKTGRETETETEDELESGQETGIDFSDDEADAWREGDLEECIRPCKELTCPDNVKRPIEYFMFYFDDDMLNHIVEQSNIYSMQKDGKPLELTVQELKTFLGLMIYMGICNLPNMRDYWSSEMRVPQIADCMAHKRFQKIRSHIHFADNLDDSEEVMADRYRKVRPLISMMQNKCRALEQEGRISIDEITIGYKGSYAGSLKQYNPKKPTKYGFKFFGLASSSGQIYDFLPYCGGTTFLNCGLSEEELDMGVGAQAVISLCKQIKDPDNAFVFFDNWFNGLNLLSYLKNTYNILALGTIRKDRIQKCPLMNEKDFRKLPRGSVESQVSAEATVVVRWLDSKPVLLASNAAGVEPKTYVKRYIKSAGCRQDVSCPRIIQLYNQHMGGVDLSDQYVAENSVPTRSKRWYFPLFGYMIDLALANSYIQYNKDNELLGQVPDLKCSKEFRLEVSKSLRAVERQRGRPSTEKVHRKNLIQSPTYRPAEETRLDGLNHWPNSERKMMRCKNCKVGKTAYKCTKCNLNLCLKADRNCFVEYHSRAFEPQPRRPKKKT
ncbi:hypothetical protein FOCC_FOCC013480 [Frankliniella occidentalis]|nr:hypothetical protein FOCC_FOCC013480 [Frankliniella occidentalis]